MTPKQLANVLIKILGLSLCIHSITGAVLSVISLFVAMGIQSHTQIELWIRPLSLVISVALGIGLIIYSQQIADKLFKES